MDRFFEPVEVRAELIRPPRSPEEALEIARRPARAVTATAASRPDGCFLLAVPEPGSWMVRIEARGHLPLALERWVEGGSLALPPAILEGAEDVSLAIFRPVGGPFREGPVFGVDPGHLGDGWRPAAQWSWPDRDGSVSFAVGDGGLFLLAWNSRLGSAAKLIGAGRIRGRHQDLALRFTPASSQRWIAVDSAGGAADHAVVSLAGLPVAATDRDGIVDLPLRSGQAALLTFDDGRRFGRANGPDRAEPEPVERSVVLSPRPTVRGMLRDAVSGSPIAGAVIWAEGPTRLDVRSDDGGRFVLPVAMSPDDPSTLWVAARGYPIVWLRPSEEKPERIELTLPPTCEIRGQVTDEAGEPISRAAVTARPLDDTLPRATAVAYTAADGRFSLGLALDVPHRVEVLRAGYLGARAELEGPRACRVEERTLILPRGGSITGHLENPAGQPIAAARTVARPWHGGQRSAKNELRPGRHAASAENGNFIVERLATGRWDLEVTAAGRVTRRWIGLEVPAGTTVDLGRIALLAGTTLAGSVVDEEGRPVDQAEVEVLDRQGELVARAETEADGLFAFQHVPDAPLALVARARGFRDRRLRLASGTGEPVSVTMTPLASISGRVVDREARPLVGSMVQAWFPLRSGPIAETDAVGRFTLTDLEPGPIELGILPSAASRTRLENVRVVYLEPGERRDDIVLEVPPLARLEVRIVGGRPPENPPNAATVVRLWPPGDGPPRLAEAPERGSFAFDDLRPGRYRIEAAFRERPHRAIVRRVDLPPGRTFVELELPDDESTGVIAGSLVNSEGTPAFGVPIQVLAIAGIRGGSARTDAGGGFRIDGLADGAYRVTATPVTGPAAVAERVQVVEGTSEPVALALEADGSITGEVRGAIDTTPRLSIRARGPAGRQAAADLAGDGSFTLPGLASGHWQLEALSPVDGRRAAATVEVLAGESAHSVLEVDEGFGLFGTVMLDGEPTEALTVAAEDLSIDGWVRHGGTDHRGTFTLSDMKEGTFRVTVTRRGDPLVIETLEIRAGDELFLQGRTGSIIIDVAGDAEGAGGEPIHGATVALVGDSVAPLAAPGARTDATGMARLDRVAAGRRVLRVEAPGYRQVTREVGIPAGGTTEVSIRMEVADPLRIQVATADGSVPQAVRLLVRHRGETFWSRPRVVLDSTGTAEVDALPPGRYEAWAAVAGVGTAMAYAGVPGPQVLLIIPETRWFEHSVPALDSAGVAGSISLVDERGHRLTRLTETLELESSWPLVDGFARIPEVPVGRWLLRVDVGTHRVDERWIVVP